MVIFIHLTEKIKNNFFNYGLFLLLVITLALIAYFRVSIQLNIGPPYDTFDFLANAAEFAGKSIGYTDLRPPFLSLLTSFVFRFDVISEAPIFIIDGIIYILGTIGLFLFLKQRFNSINSFLGCIIYSTFPILLTYMGVGYPDLPSVSISIWALYLTFLAVKKDSKYFLLSFPIAMLSFLTKYNQALIIFPIFLLILINWQKIKKQNMIIGMILASLILIPFLMFFSWKYGSPISPFFDFYGSSTGPVSGQNFDYNPDMLFYIKNFPLVIGTGALITLLVIVGGLVLNWFKLIKKGINLNKTKEQLDSLKLRFLIILILIGVLIFSLGNVSYIISELIFFILCFASYKLLKADSKWDLDLLFLSWLISFLIFSSVFLMKDIRYYLSLLPAFTYFLIRGLELIDKQVGLIKQHKFTTYLAPLLILIVLASTMLYLPSLVISNNDNRVIDHDMAEASHWLMSYDPEYKTVVIYSDLGAVTAWYLKTDVKKMPIFRDNDVFYYSISVNNLNIGDMEKINNLLLNNNAKYYFSIHQGLSLNNYRVITKIGRITIYQKI